MLGQGRNSHPSDPRLNAPRLPDSTFNWIKATTNVHDTWEVLKCVFEECSKALVADLIQRFQNKHYDEDESIRSHFENLADLHKQLAAMGNAGTDEDYIDMLLASLLAFYNGAVSSICWRYSRGSAPDRYNRKMR
jgi:hypothetical protein